MGQIRKAQSSDADELLAMLKRFFGINGESTQVPITPDIISKEIHRLPLSYVVVSREGEIIGLVIPRRIFKDDQTYFEEGVQNGENKLDAFLRGDVPEIDK